MGPRSNDRRNRKAVSQSKTGDKRDVFRFLAIVVFFARGSIRTRHRSGYPAPCDTARPDVSLDTQLWEQSWTTGDWRNYLAAGTLPGQAEAGSPSIPWRKPQSLRSRDSAAARFRIQQGCCDLLCSTGVAIKTLSYSLTWRSFSRKIIACARISSWRTPFCANGFTAAVISASKAARRSPITAGEVVDLE